MAEQKVLYPSLDTPAVLVDMNKMEANIKEMSQLAAAAGVRLRPHVKSHQCTEIAKLQVEAGACGVDVGSMGQAEAMAEGGIDDIVIAHPGFYGGHKLERFKRLLSQPGLKITTVVDMVEQAEGISRAGRELGRKIPMLIKVDVATLGGSARFGIPPGEPTLNLAKKLCQLPGIDFTGLYAHEMPKVNTPEALDKFAFETIVLMSELARKIKSEGIAIEDVTLGASNTFRYTCRYLKEGKFPEITEIHPGHCVIGDIMYMTALANKREACAVTVLATVISTAHPEKAAIDAGYKTFGADYLIGHVKEPDFYWNGLASFGSVQGRPDLRPAALAGETGFVYYMDPDKKLNFGERIEIVPNNATLVINIHDQIYGVRNGMVERVFAINGRGRGS